MKGSCSPCLPGPFAEALLMKSSNLSTKFKGLRNPLDLNTAEVTAEVVLALQRAIPRLCKFGGNSFEMIFWG